MSSMNDDNTLVQRALKGDRKAFEMIIRRYQQPLVNYLGRMTGEREIALDFAQDVFLKAYASLASFRPSFKFSTWLFKIASNHLIDHWRKKTIAAFTLDRPINDNCSSGLQVEGRGPFVVRTYELT